MTNLTAMAAIKLCHWRMQTEDNMHTIVINEKLGISIERLELIRLIYIIELQGKVR